MHAAPAASPRRRRRVGAARAGSTRPGPYDFFCSIHRDMRGTVIVQPARPDPDADGDRDVHGDRDADARRPPTATPTQSPTATPTATASPSPTATRHVRPALDRGPRQLLAGRLRQRPGRQQRHDHARRVGAGSATRAGTSSHNVKFDAATQPTCTQTAGHVIPDAASRRCPRSRCRRAGPASAASTPRARTRSCARRMPEMTGHRRGGREAGRGADARCRPRRRRRCRGRPRRRRRPRRRSCATRRPRRSRVPWASFEQPLSTQTVASLAAGKLKLDRALRSAGRARSRSPSAARSPAGCKLKSVTLGYGQGDLRRPQPLRGEPSS